MLAKINGLNLAYTDQGRGMPVLLLHAFPQNRAMWAPQVEALSKTHRIIAPDFRGFGESDDRERNIVPGRRFRQRGTLHVQSHRSRHL